MKINKNSRHLRDFSWLILAALLFLSIHVIRIYRQVKNDPENIYHEFQKEIRKSESDTKNRVNFLVLNFSSTAAKNSKSNFEVPGEGNGDDEIDLFVYKGDSLIFWNDNKLLLNGVFTKNHKTGNFACRLKSGWYGFYCEQKGIFHFLGAYQIKNEYPFQNEYLSDHFSHRFDIPESVSIRPEPGQYPVYAGDSTYLFSLSFEAYKPAQEGFSPVIFLLFIIGSLCLFYFLFRALTGVSWFRTRQDLLVISYIILLSILRLCQYYYAFPSELYDSELFSPAWYSSSSFLPSLGDYTLDSILLLVISIVVYKKVTIPPGTALKHHITALIPAAFAPVAILIFFLIFGYLISDLVINSALSLNLTNISGLSAESGFGLFIITAMSFSLWVISAKMLDAGFVEPGRKKWQILSTVIAVCLYILFCRATGWGINFAVVLFFLVYVAWHWCFKSKQRAVFSMQSLIFYLCFFSVLTTFLLNRSNQVKESGKLNLMAGKLVSQRNPVTEVLYEQVERKLIADTILNRWLSRDPWSNKISQDSLTRYMRTRYFKDYWKKYQIQVTFCDPAKKLKILPQGYLVDCNAYFLGIINTFGASTACPNFFFLDYGFGKEYYLGVLSGKIFGITPGTGLSIFLEFNLKNTFSDPGYPGLLMDKTRLDLPEISTYSYGLFQNGKLVRAAGANGYKMELNKYKGFSKDKAFFKEDHLIHFQYRISDAATLIITKKEDNFISYASPFSYLFILFSVLVLVAAGVINFPENLKKITEGLRNRLNISLISILVVTMLAIGIVQVINIIRINSKKNLDYLRERVYSVVIEVQHKYGSLPDINMVSRNEIGDFLVKLSNVFFSDINVYDENGFLISSSRPQIFEEGLLSERMNSTACQRLIRDKNSIFIHNETIGSMQFNSAYLPFYNEQDDLLGFINLPYFAKQDESKKEISSFLVTFINIYILLILIGVFVTVLISNYITAPLAILAEKLSQLRIGKVNEKISWNQKDEIGQLVSEYNRMTDELGRSAELLARSERESAWREMARQVAHEIKNPLTPMKLSAQHLEKARNEKAPDLDQRLARFIRTLVEQIDTLSVIASNFSDFAKMPPVVHTKVDLEEVIRFVLTLYQDTPQIHYEFRSETDGSSVLADRSQLIRVFTNLINNAVQAIGDHQDGHIRIHLEKEGHYFIVTVSDNGCGIPPERTDRIFQPDFTTKTGGMGLGLAIVKGIIEAMNGRITFRSEEKKGTSFIIKIPENEDQ